MRVFALLIAVSFFAFGQAVVENATITGGGSTAAAAGSKDASKSIGGVFGSLTKTLDKVDGSKAAEVDSKRVEPPASLASSAKERYSPKTIQPGDVAVGMTRSDLLKKIGKPFMKTSRTEGPQFVETYYYQGADDVVVVTLREGKVTTVTPPAEPEVKKASV